MKKYQICIFIVQSFRRGFDLSQFTMFRGWPRGCSRCSRGHEEEKERKKGSRIEPGTFRSYDLRLSQLSHWDNVNIIFVCLFVCLCGRQSFFGHRSRMIALSYKEIAHACALSPSNGSAGYCLAACTYCTQYRLFPQGVAFISYFLS